MGINTEIITNNYLTTNPILGQGQPAILTTTDQAYGWIRQHLYKKGESSQRLSDLTIAAQLQISRTPVRQALDRLAMEGLINADPRRGFSTRIFTQQDVHEIYDLWETNEALALRLAWPHFTKEELRLQSTKIDGLRVKLPEPEKELFEEDFVKADFQFHNFLITCCGNGRLVRYLATLHGQVALLQVNYNFYSRRMDEILKEQAQILNELLEDFPEKAAALLSTLIQKSKVELLQEVNSKTFIKKSNK